MASGKSLTLKMLDRVYRGGESREERPTAERDRTLAGKKRIRARREARR